MKAAMKYLLVVLVILGLVGGLAVLSTSCTVQSVNPTITASLINNAIQLTATTPSEGTNYCIDSWGGATELGTSLNNGNYISTAEFTPTNSGTFMVTYRITMFGKDGVVWMGTASTTFTITATSVSIIFHDDAGVEVGRMNFYNAWPTKHTLPSFN